MQIEKVIGKKCLIRKNTENLPIEAHIICLNEDRTKFSAKLSSGEIIWLNINDYILLESINTIDRSKNKYQLLFD